MPRSNKPQRSYRHLQAGSKSRSEQEPCPHHGHRPGTLVRGPPPPAPADLAHADSAMPWATAVTLLTFPHRHRWLRLPVPAACAPVHLPRRPGNRATAHLQPSRHRRSRPTPSPRSGARRSPRSACTSPRCWPSREYAISAVRPRPGVAMRDGSDSLFWLDLA
jgi:hypothetical protein